LQALGLGFERLAAQAQISMSPDLIKLGLSQGFQAELSLHITCSLADDHQIQEGTRIRKKDLGLIFFFRPSQLD